VSAGVIQGHLVERVTPDYPSLARAAGITGTVTLEGVIDTDGKVTELRVLEGHPLLTGAAVDAVGQWRYEPYLLNGQPIDVVTLFSIAFRMD
jgi:protein TonB